MRTELARLGVNPGIIQIKLGIAKLLLDMLANVFFVVILVIMVTDSNKTPVAAGNPASGGEAPSPPRSEIPLNKPQVRDPCGTIHSQVLDVRILGLMTGDAHLRSTAVEHHIIVIHLAAETGLVQGNIERGFVQGNDGFDFFGGGK